MATKKGKSKVLLSAPGITVRMTAFTAEPQTRKYDIPPQAWHRGLKLMRKYGADAACYKIDDRAMRCLHKGQDKMSDRWRDLIVAILAIDERERLPSDVEH